MAAPTPYFVDPGVAPGGVGTAADPWDTVAVALAAIVRNAADGDQINVVSDQAPGVLPTVDDVTVAVMTLVAYGAPAVDAPLIIRGCSRTQDPVTGLLTGLPVANNRGIGGMDGNNGGWSIYDGVAGATNYVHFIDMHLHNTAANQIAVLGTFSSLIGCRLDTATVEALRTSSTCNILNCHLSCTSANYVAFIQTVNTFRGNMIEQAGAGGGAFLAAGNIACDQNIVSLSDAASYGLRVSSSSVWVTGNSILQNAVGTAAAIELDNVALTNLVINSNLLEGFSGVGGSGIDLFNTTRHLFSLSNNSFFNNENDIIQPGDVNYYEDNDFIMAASPFLKEGALTFDNRFNYFKPAIPVRGRAFPNGCRFDRGAVQVRLATEREIAAVTITTIPARIELDPI